MPDKPYRDPDYVAPVEPRPRRPRPLHALWWTVLSAWVTVAVLRFVLRIHGATPIWLAVVAVLATFALFLYDENGGTFW